MPPSSQKDSSLQTERLAEFGALRKEIELRIRLRYNLMALAFTVFGAISALSSKLGLSSIVFLFYPVLALFLAVEWSYHDIRIKTIGNYIKQEIERDLPSFQWQHFLDDVRKERGPFREVAWSTGGILIGSSLLALIQVILNVEQLEEEIGNIWLYTLTAIDIIAIIAAGFFIQKRRVNKASAK